MLGFGGRIGRMQYFLRTIVLAVVMTALTLAVVFAMVAPATPAIGSEREIPGPVMAVSVFVLTATFVWFTLALQAKRLRDIGWKPLYVLPAWLAANVVDALLSPDGGPSGGSGSAVGLIVNFVMVAILLFWPGRGDASGDWSEPSFGSREPAAPIVRATSRTRSAVTASAPATGFGRRGL